MFVYLRQQWVDKRLAHGIDASLALGATDVERIWLPDTYITNANDYEVFTSNQLVLINGEGQVFYFAYVRIAGACQMNLVKFPMDVQRCHLTLESCKCGVGRGERGEGREGEDWKERACRMNLVNFPIGCSNLSLDIGKLQPCGWGGWNQSFFR